MENKKIKIKELEEGEYFFNNAGEIFNISVFDNGLEEEENKLEYVVYEIPIGDNDSASHLFQFAKNDKIYLVNQEFKDWYLRESDIKFEENEYIEIIDPHFMSYEKYLKETEEE